MGSVIGSMIIDFLVGAVMFIIKRILLYPARLRQKYIAKGITIRNFQADARDATRPPSIDLSFVIDSNTTATATLRQATICLDTGGW